MLEEGERIWFETFYRDYAARKRPKNLRLKAGLNPRTHFTESLLDLWDKGLIHLETRINDELGFDKPLRSWHATITERGTVVAKLMGLDER